VSLRETAEEKRGTRSAIRITNNPHCTGNAV